MRLDFGFRVSGFGRAGAPGGRPKAGIVLLERESRGRGQGFSLLETLLAVTIFSVAIVGIIEGIAASSRTQAWLESQSRAAMLARNVMAELEHIGEYTVGEDGGEYDGDYLGYSWMSRVLETEYEELFEIQVVIMWMEGGAEREYRLVTYVRERYFDEFEEPDSFATRGQ